MPLFLYRITKPRWARDATEFPWLGAQDIPADIYREFQVKGGDLSVWHIEDDRSNLHDVVTAIAATRDKFDTFDYGLIKQEHIDSANIRLVVHEGDTPLLSANHWHRDLVELTIDKLTFLIKEVFDNWEKDRFSAKQVQQFIVTAAQNQQLDLARMKDALKAKL